MPNKSLPIATAKDSALELVNDIASQTNKGDEHTELAQSTKRLSSSLEFLANIVGNLMADNDILTSELSDSKQSYLKSQDATSKTSGLEEEKLLAAIDKWRRRFEEKETENDKLTDMLVTLKEKYEILSDENAEFATNSKQQNHEYAKLTKIIANVSDRLDSSIETIDNILD